MYQEKFLRNPLTKEQQQSLRSTTFALVGLGGTGGFILENLLRCGAERLMLFEHDRFELSNFNRQPLAVDDSLDMPKVDAAIARAKAINSSVQVRGCGGFFEGSDLGAADILLDGADNIQAKHAMAQAARREGIPYVFCSASGTRGMVSVFTDYGFEDAFQLKRPLEPERYQRCQSILCPAASLAGTIAASQAISKVLGKPCVEAPEALFFDIFREDIFWRARLG